MLLHDRVVDGAPLTFALAFGVGVLCHVAAGHLRVPSIVLLLAAGVVLGPDVGGLIAPERLGSGLHAIVQVAVAIILFEGSLNLDLPRLRREATAIRRLVTWGALLTTVGAALAAHVALGWNWAQSLLFGTLVIVTGPTVIRPLLRTVPLRTSVATVLEAEGLLIDPVGAIAAALALSIVVAPEQGGVASFAWGLTLRLAVGIGGGGIAGAVLAQLLRTPRLIPSDARHLVALAGALATYALAETTTAESGILAVVVAGVIVGNSERALARELGQFQEHLTVGLIGLLFVLLAADVRLDHVTALGRGGGLTVAALVLVVRPLSVWLCTRGTDFSWRERAFLSWVAPRGVVAAAVASITAGALEEQGSEGGPALRALVFLTIAITVAVQGGTASLMARLLGVRVKGRDSVVILPASELGLLLGGILRQSWERVVFADSNPGNCRLAEERGFPVVYGDVFEPATLSRLRLERTRLVVAVTGNPVLNNHFAETAKLQFKVPEVYAAMGTAGVAASERSLAKYGGRMLFASPQDVQRWDIRIRHGLVEVARAVHDPAVQGAREGSGTVDKTESHLIVAVEHEGRWIPASVGLEPTDGARAVVLVNTEQRVAAAAALAAQAWRLDSPPSATGPSRAIPA